MRCTKLMCPGGEKTEERARKVRPRTLGTRDRCPFIYEAARGVLETSGLPARARDKNAGGCFLLAGRRARARCCLVFVNADDEDSRRRDKTIGPGARRSEARRVRGADKKTRPQSAISRQIRQVRPRPSLGSQLATGARARLCSDLRATRLRTRSPAMPRPIKSAPNARAESPRLALALSRTRRPSRSVQPHSRWPPYTPSPPPPTTSLLPPTSRRSSAGTVFATSAAQLSNRTLHASDSAVAA